MIRKAHEEYVKNKDQKEKMKKPRSIKSMTSLTLDDPIEVEEKPEKKPFFPSTFGRLMNYLTYRLRRDNIKNAINKYDFDNPEKEKPLDEFFAQFNELLSLQIDRDTNMNRFNALDKESQEYRMRQKALYPSKLAFLR